MTTTVLAPYLTQQFLDSSGAPLVGGLVYTYQGGSSIPVATWTDSTGITPNTNPIVLNARGECSIWLIPNQSYKFVLTDAANNTIWTRDNVTQSQLISLYGGVDTGIVNAYILAFTAPYTAYTDGIVVYWIPAHTNTGPSTINMSFNGGLSFLGVINITNGDGTALTAGQIVANAPMQLLIKGGAAVLVDTAVASGSFTMNCVSDGSVAALTVFYTRIGNTVTLSSTGGTGAASATNFDFSLLPVSITPVRNILNTARYTGAQSNSTDCDCTIQVGTSGHITLGHYTAGSSTLSAWSASGNKTCPPFIITYLLN